MKPMNLVVCAMVMGAASLTLAQTRTEGTSGELPLRIVGHAVSVRGVGNPTGANRVELRVTGTSPNAMQARMLDALKTGQQALLEVLRDAPSVGTVRFGTELAWDLRYAHRQPLDEGGVRIAMITDRPMGVFELWNAPRYAQYPFTLITIDLDASGRGMGEMILAARITADPGGQFVHVQNFASEPIQLLELEAEVER